MSELGGKPGVKTQQEKTYLWPNIETNKGRSLFREINTDKIKKS